VAELFTGLAGTGSVSEVWINLNAGETLNVYQYPDNMKQVAGKFETETDNLSKTSLIFVVYECCFVKAKNGKKAAFYNSVSWANYGVGFNNYKPLGVPQHRLMKMTMESSLSKNIMQMNVQGFLQILELVHGVFTIF
jgi:hypothetical protein